MSRDDGRAECQVVGCDAPAQAYGVTFEMDDVEIELRLCRRHEADLYGGARIPPGETAEQRARS